MTVSEMDNSLYLPDEIHDSSKHSLYLLSLYFILPCLLCYICSTYLLIQSKCSNTLLQYYIYSTLNRDVYTTKLLTTESKQYDKNLEYQLTLLLPIIYIIHILPLILLVVYVAHVYIYVDVMLAISLLYIGLMILIVTYTCILYPNQLYTSQCAWSVILLISAGICLTVAYMIALSVIAQPYTFLSVGIVILMFNSIATSAFFYYIESIPLVSYNQYKGFTTSLLDDIRFHQMSPGQQQFCQLQQRQYDHHHHHHGSTAYTNDMNHSSHTSSNTRARKLCITFILYLLCLSTLGGYVGINVLMGYTTSSYITLLALLVCDIVSILMLLSNCMTPWVASISNSLSRLLFICFYENYYLVGHSIYMLYMGIYITYRLINVYLPTNKLPAYDKGKPNDQSTGVTSVYNKQTPHNNHPNNTDTFLQTTRINVHSAHNNPQENGSATPNEYTSYELMRQILERNISMREIMRNEYNTQSHQPMLTIIAVWLLLITFIVDIIFSWYLNDQLNTTDHHSIVGGIHTSVSQYFIGLVTLYLLYIICTYMCIQRSYRNRYYRINRRLLSILTCQYLTVWIISALYYIYVNHDIEHSNVSEYTSIDSPLFIALSVFGYPLFYLLTYTYTHWRVNDFHIIQPPTRRIPYNSTWFHALWYHRGVNKYDIYLPASFLLSVSLIICLGYFIHLYLAFAMFIVLTTVIPIIEWFHSFKLSKHTVLQITMSFCAYVGGIVLVFIYILHGSITQDALLLLLCTLLYPTLLLLSLGAYKYYDNQYQVDDSIVWLLFSGVFCMVIDLFLLSISMSPWYIGGVACLIFLLFVLSAITLPSIRTLSKTIGLILSTTYTLCITAMCIGVAWYGGYPFAGYTMFMVFLCISLIGAIIQQKIQTMIRVTGSIFYRYIIHYTPTTIFPVYLYDTMLSTSSRSFQSASTMHSNDTPLIESNDRIGIVYALLGVTYIWSISSLYFIPHIEVGIVLLCIILVSTSIYTCSLFYNAQFSNNQLATTMQWLNPASPLYHYILHQCKVDATKAYLLKNITTTHHHSMTSSASSSSNHTHLHVLNHSVGKIIEELKQEKYSQLLNELENVSNQDPSTGYQSYQRLSVSIPSFSFYLLTSHTTTIHFQNTHLSRRQAVVLASILYYQSMTWYERDYKYLLHLHCSLLQSINIMRHEYMTYIQQMLRNEGDKQMTIEYLLSLPLYSDELISYENRFIEYLQRLEVNEHVKHRSTQQQQRAEAYRKGYTLEGTHTVNNHTNTQLRGSAGTGGEVDGGSTLQNTTGTDTTSSKSSKAQLIDEYQKQQQLEQNQIHQALNTALQQHDLLYANSVTQLTQQHQQHLTHLHEEIQQIQRSITLEEQQEHDRRIKETSVKVKELQIQVAKQEVALNLLKSSIEENQKRITERYDMELHKINIRLEKFTEKYRDERRIHQLNKDKELLQLEKQLHAVKQKMVGENALRNSRREEKDSLVEQKIRELRSKGKIQSADLLEQRWNEQKVKRTERDQQRVVEYKSYVKTHELQVQKVNEAYKSSSSSSKNGNSSNTVDDDLSNDSEYKQQYELMKQELTSVATKKYHDELKKLNEQEHLLSDKTNAYNAVKVQLQLMIQESMNQVSTGGNNRSSTGILLQNKHTSIEQLQKQIQHDEEEYQSQCNTLKSQLEEQRLGIETQYQRQIESELKTRQKQQAKDAEMVMNDAMKQQCCTRIVLTNHSSSHDKKKSNTQIILQSGYLCYTCYPEDTLSSVQGSTHTLCISCIKGCHQDHQVEAIQAGGYIPTYCDCQGDVKKSSNGQQPLSKSSTICELNILPAERQQYQQLNQIKKQSDSTSHLINPVATILSECTKQGIQYRDLEFPPSEKSLFINPTKPHNLQWKQQCVWKRLSELMKGMKEEKEDSSSSSSKTAVLPSTALFTPTANDVKQGKISDCYFLSACTVLTYKPHVFQQIFLLNDYNQVGVYAIRMYINGRQHTIVIDDYIPTRLDPSDPTKPHYIPLFAQCDSYQHMWVPLLEKAYAKLYGSYQAIEGGWVDSALVDLTGGIPERLCWSNPSVKKSIRDGTLWSTLYAYYSQGFLLGCGSPMGTSDSAADASKWGIVQSHAYAILRLQEVDGIQLIQVRNPWGKFEWNGEYSDRDDHWNRRLVSKTGREVAEDGAFFMTFHDFCIHFDEVYVCRYFDTKKWITQSSIYGEWKDHTAGGSMKCTTVSNNTQYAIYVVDSECDIVIQLIQEDQRSRGKAGQFQIIVIELYDNNGKIVTQKQRGKMLSNTGGNQQSIHIQTTLKALKTPYTLLCCTYEAGIQMTYTLKYYATSRVKVQQYVNDESGNTVNTNNSVEGIDEKQEMVDFALQLSTKTSTSIKPIIIPAKVQPEAPPRGNKPHNNTLRGATANDGVDENSMILATRSTYHTGTESRNENVYQKPYIAPPNKIISPYMLAISQMEGQYTA